MAAVLQPGVRKLWSESDLAKLNQIVSASLPDQNDQPIDRQSDGLPPSGQQRNNTQLGRARRLPGSGIDPDANTENEVQALHAINATLTDSDFQSADRWETTGTVELANGAATLSESASQQSQLSQGFVLSAEDRFLTFTVHGLQLTDSTNGPDDAFEVALLNANTHAAATSIINLTRTDALLNIQADGSERRIDGLRRIDNADGSRTYVLDLVGIGAGEGVALSFDLIGFGAADSRVSIRDVRLGRTPQTADDSTSVIEDNTVVIDALSNDTDGRLAGFVPTLVAAPAHGAVVVNADGTFSYTPNANYSGEDSFSYKLSNGTLDSNIGRVSINVAPANDAPVAHDASASVEEDGQITVDLAAFATDIDSSGLIPTIVEGPPTRPLRTQRRRHFHLYTAKQLQWYRSSDLQIQRWIVGIQSRNLDDFGSGGKRYADRSR